MEECSSDFACVADAQNLYIKWFRRVRGPAATQAIATLSIIFTPNTRQVLPKLQSIIEFLSLNLSDLCNKISLCNIIDKSAAKNGIRKGRLYKEKENE